MKTASDAETIGVPLEIASWKETQAKIAGHRGKVVVVDLWTTW